MEYAFYRSLSFFLEMAQNYKLEDTLNVVKIMFYLATGTAALLSYIAAKKSIFSPIKTEVFKDQIKVINNLMELTNTLRKKEFVYKCGVADNVYDIYESIAEQVSCKCEKLDVGQTLEIMHHEELLEVVMTIEKQENNEIKIKALHTGASKKYIDWTLKLLSLHNSVFLPHKIDDELQKFRNLYREMLDDCLLTYEEHTKTLFNSAVSKEFHKVSEIRFIKDCLEDIYNLESTEKCYNQIIGMRNVVKTYIKSADIWDE